MHPCRELAPLLVLCEDNPDERTVRCEIELIQTAPADEGLKADLLAIALRIGGRELDWGVLERVFREALPMVQGATIVDDWIAEGEARGEARGREQEARELVTSILEERFGSLPPVVLARIKESNVEWCRRLARNAVHVARLEDLDLQPAPES